MAFVTGGLEQQQQRFFLSRLHLEYASTARAHTAARRGGGGHLRVRHNNNKQVRWAGGVSRAKKLWTQ